MYNTFSIKSSGINFVKWDSKYTLIIKHKKMLITTHESNATVNVRNYTLWMILFDSNNLVKDNFI